MRSATIIGKLLLDSEDMHLLNEFSWHVGGNGYIETEIGGRVKGNRRVVKLHRLIMMPADHELVDHINMDKLDNRRNNLRIADRSTNGMNRGAQRNSLSGIKGVSWSKAKNKWRIVCNVRGKQYHLGYAGTLDEAKRVYASKIGIYHGEFSRCE